MVVSNLRSESKGLPVLTSSQFVKQHIRWVNHNLSFKTCTALLWYENDSLLKSLRIITMSESYARGLYASRTSTTRNAGIFMPVILPFESLIG